MQDGARPQAKEHPGLQGSYRKQCKTPPQSLWREAGSTNTLTVDFRIQIGKRINVFCKPILF